jgi:hypothetical protein
LGDSWLVLGLPPVWYKSPALKTIVTWSSMIECGSLPRGKGPKTCSSHSPTVETTPFCPGGAGLHVNQAGLRVGVEVSTGR